MRRINQAGTFLFAVLFVLGPPTAAATWISRQRWDWPTQADAQRWMEQPLTAGTILAGIALIAGVGWLALTIYLCWYAGVVLAGWWRRIRRMPLPGPVQVTAGSMAGMAALAMPVVVAPHADATGTATSSAVPHLSEPTPAAGADAGEGPAAIAREGVVLPGGGWIPYRTAAAVATLAGLVWLYRRYHYRPRPPRPGAHHSDADLQPLPVTADAITVAVAGDGGPPSPVAVPVPLLDDLPTGALVLRGPGATDAVRGLLVTAAVTAAFTEQVAVTLHGHDLRDLVGVDLGLALPGVRVEDPGNLAAAGGRRTAEQPMVTIARRPPRRSDSPITTVVFVAADSRATLGWNVGVDGTITGGSPGTPIRLPVLPRQAAADLLRLVEQHQRARIRPPVQVAAPPPRSTGTAAPGNLTLLGGCQLSVDGEPVRFSRRAALQVMAYLAVHPDGATANELIGAIWPGIAPATITGRLYTTMNGLRSRFQPVLTDPVLRDGDRYQLNPQAVRTDLEQLRHALRAAAAAVTRDQRRQAASQLLDLYRGELAAGSCWPWLQPAREALRRDLIDAYLHLAENAEPEFAVRMVQASIAIDPYNADLHQRARGLLAATGNPTTAHDRSFEQRLSEAGLHPPAEDTPSTPPGR